MQKFTLNKAKHICLGFVIMAVLSITAYHQAAADSVVHTLIDRQQNYYVQESIGNDKNTGDGWGAEHALATIQRAIDLAQTNAEPSVIYVAGGTYYENLNIRSATDITIRGGFSAQDEEAGPDPVANPTVIDGGNTDRAVNISSSQNVSIEGFVIQNGNTIGAGSGISVDESSSVTISGNTIQNNRSTEDWGGGIGIVFSEVTITDNVIQNNQTTASGGGISFYGEDPNPCSGIVSGNTITGNSSHYAAGMMIENANVTVSGNSIQNNIAEQGGGGISVSDCASSIIENNIISDNTAGYDGGGMSIENSNLLVTGNTIQNNSAAGNGGGLSVSDCASSSIQNNRISDNTATYDGAGIFYYHSSAEIGRNFIQNNTGGNWGGGICVFGSAGRIVNNVIYNNRSLVGGGISYYEQSSAVVINNTIVSNSASESNSGGIGCYNGSSAIVLNTILWGNTPEQLDSDSESTFDVTYSSVQGGYSGHGNIGFDPMFISESPYNFHLQSYSGCTGGGKMTSDVPTEDIEGNPRPNPQSSRPDMGAYEAAETGYLVASGLWIRAVIHTDGKGAIDALWKKGGEGNTAGGSRVIWGHFYASSSDVSWGSENNPDIFVKIWFDRGGRLDVNFFHVSVPEITVYSDYIYDGDPDEEGTTTMDRRYIRQYYENGQSYSDEQNEDGVSPEGYAPENDPDGYVTINDLRIGSVIQTVGEKGAIEAIWQQGGQDTTARGDEVVWGHVYASPADVTWGDENNPDLFIKIWFDVTGRIDVNYFHVSVPVIDVYSDYPSDGFYDQKGTTIMSDRYTRHEF